MPPSPARKPRPTPRAAKVTTRRPTVREPVVIYVASSIDGTSFALDPESQERIRSAFPGVDLSTRRVFISHDTREAAKTSIKRFEDQVAILLTGVDARRLANRFGAVSFRDPSSERELLRLASPASPLAAQRP